MSMVNIKIEPVSPAASAAFPPPRKSKRRVLEPPQEMPKPLVETVVKLEPNCEAPSLPRGKRNSGQGKLLGGQPQQQQQDVIVVEGERAGDNNVEAVVVRKEKRLERNTMGDQAKEKNNLEVAKLKATVKKYEATVVKLMHKMKSQQAGYKQAIGELQQTNENLREEITSIRDTIYGITSQRDLEQDLMDKLKGDNSDLLSKNNQLEADLSKMIQNIQHSDGILEEMRQRVVERDNEMTTLATEKKYLTQQLEDMRRLSMSMSRSDIFSPPDGRKASSSATSYESGCCKAGSMGAWFGSGTSSLSKVFVCGILVSVGLGYFFQNLHPAQAQNPAECDYDIEMMSGM